MATFYKILLKGVAPMVKTHEIDAVINTFKEETQTLAVWWCELNNGIWPGEVPVEKPATFNICVSRNFLAQDGTAERGTVAGRLFWGILDCIGLKECLRQQKIQTFPGEEFDFWYEHAAGVATCHTS